MTQILRSNASWIEMLRIQWRKKRNETLMSNDKAVKSNWPGRLGVSRATTRCLWLPKTNFANLLVELNITGLESVSTCNDVSSDSDWHDERRIGRLKIKMITWHYKRERSRDMFSFNFNTLIIEMFGIREKFWWWRQGCNWELVDVTTVERRRNPSRIYNARQQ